MFAFAFLFTAPVYLFRGANTLEQVFQGHLIFAVCFFVVLLSIQRILSDGQKITKRDEALRVDREAFQKRHAVGWCEDAEILSSSMKPHTLRGLMMLITIIPLVVSGICALIHDLGSKYKRNEK